MQTKKHSFLEAVTSTVVGFLITLGVQSILFPLYGIHISTAANFSIVGVMTLVSIARQYVLRRVFNHVSGRGNADLTDQNNASPDLS